MNIKEIVTAYLLSENLDGLVNADNQCGCSLLDGDGGLMPCGEPSEYCECGVRRKVTPDDDYYQEFDFIVEVPQDKHDDPEEVLP